MCAFAHSTAIGTRPIAGSRQGLAGRRALAPARRDSSRKISAASRMPANVSGRICERPRQKSVHHASMTSGATPVAPMRRAASQAMPNAASVVSQRHAKSPHTPPSFQNGHSAARKSHEGSTSGAPCVGQVQSCVCGTAWVCQISRPTTRCCQMSVS